MCRKMRIFTMQSILPNEYLINLSHDSVVWSTFLNPYNAVPTNNHTHAYSAYRRYRERERTIYMTYACGYMEKGSGTGPDRSSCAIEKTLRFRGDSYRTDISRARHSFLAVMPRSAVYRAPWISLSIWIAIVRPYWRGSHRLPGLLSYCALRTDRAIPPPPLSPFCISMLRPFSVIRPTRPRHPLLNYPTSDERASPSCDTCAYSAITACRFTTCRHSHGLLPHRLVKIVSHYTAMKRERVAYLIMICRAAICCLMSSIKNFSGKWNIYGAVSSQRVRAAWNKIFDGREFNEICISIVPRGNDF